MSATDEEAGISADLYKDACQFMYREARTLDENRFEEWLALLTEDVIYEMPLTMTRERAERDRTSDPDMQWFSENIHSLKMRVARLSTDYAWAEDPPTRTRHLLLNIELEPGEGTGEFVARCAFVVYASRGSLSTWETIVGHRADVLVRDGGEWKLRRRTMYLDQAVLGANTLSFFL
jgi:3-phenylpropionate/cinnamic acid dioxygenase small subunit